MKDGEINLSMHQGGLWEFKELKPKGLPKNCMKAELGRRASPKNLHEG